MATITAKLPVFIKYAEGFIEEIQNADETDYEYPTRVLLNVSIDTTKEFTVEIAKNSSLVYYNKTIEVMKNTLDCYKRFTVRNMNNDILPITKKTNGEVVACIANKEFTKNLQDGDFIPAIVIQVRYAKPHLVKYMVKDTNGIHTLMGTKYTCVRVEPAEPYKPHELTYENAESYFMMNGDQQERETENGVTKTYVHVRRADVFVGVKLKTGKTATEATGVNTPVASAMFLEPTE